MRLNKEWIAIMIVSLRSASSVKAAISCIVSSSLLYVQNHKPHKAVNHCCQSLWSFHAYQLVTAKTWMFKKNSQNSQRKWSWKEQTILTNLAISVHIHNVHGDYIESKIEMKTNEMSVLIAMLFFSLCSVFSARCRFVIQRVNMRRKRVKCDGIQNAGARHQLLISTWIKQQLFQLGEKKSGSSSEQPKKEKPIRQISFQYNDILCMLPI